MPALQSIPSLPRDAVDLLEAVGYMDARELCESHNGELIDELVKANDALHIMLESPTVDQLIRWKSLASAVVGDGFVEGDDSEDQGESASIAADYAEAVEDVAPESYSDTGPDEQVAVNFENDPEVQSMLEISPEAELIPLELIKRNNLSVAAIAEGVLLTECEGDVEMNILTPQHKVRQQRMADEVKRSSLMTSRIRTFGEAETEEHHVKPLDKGKPRDVVSLSEGLNAGLSPESRRFVRGVLHPDPWSIRISALFAVLVQIFLVTTVVAVPFLILYDLLYDVPEVMWWVLGLVSGLTLSALCYLFWGISARCRVCGQRQFSPKKCLKNTKAHHIRFMGYIFPTALHALFYKWFYCTYCGTAVRLKK